MHLFGLLLAHISHWHISMTEAGVPRHSIATHGCRAFFVCSLTLVDGSDKPNSFRHIAYLCWQINLVIGTTYQVRGSKVDKVVAIEVRGETKIVKSLS